MKNNDYVVYKYDVPINITFFSSELSEDAIFLSAANEQENLVVYFLIKNPRHEEKTVNRKFVLKNTGDYFTVRENEELVYLGTVMLDGGSYVRHLFEIKNK